jgi:hypothetical protein
MRTVLFSAVSVLVFAVGCHHKNGGTTEDGEEHTDPVGKGDGPVYTSDPNQLPPEKLDEVNRLLERRKPTVSRCLGFAVDNKELPKNARGTMTLQIIISPSGSPETVKVASSTLESKTLNECVISNVKKIQFPQVSKQFETSYTYGFEAM